MQITAIRFFVARFDNRLRVVVKVGTDEGLYVGKAGAGGAGRIAERELSAGRVCGPYAGSPAATAGGGQSFLLVVNDLIFSIDCIGTISLFCLRVARSRQKMM